MKAYFRNMIQAYSGKCDGLVYYYNPRLHRIIVRPHVKRRATEQNRVFKTVSAQLRAISPAADYKRDLAMYVELYNRKASNYRNPLNNWYNAWTRLMWNLAKSQTEYIDLETITREIIEANDLPCRTVKRAVEAGLLSPVNGYELLVGVM